MADLLPLCPCTSSCREMESISLSYTSHPYLSLGHPSFNGSAPSVPSVTPAFNDFNNYYAAPPLIQSQTHFENDITASSDDAHLVSSSMYWSQMDMILAMSPTHNQAPESWLSTEYMEGGAPTISCTPLEPSYQAHATSSTSQWWNSSDINLAYDLPAPQFSACATYDSNELRVPGTAPSPPMSFTNLQNIGHNVTLFRPSQMSQEVPDALSDRFGDILRGREVGVYQCTISDREVWLVLVKTGERALPVASSEALKRTHTHIHANNTPILPGSLTKLDMNIPNHPSVLLGQYQCCRRMQKSELSGPLPSESETDAYLYRELRVHPGTEISLALNEQLRSSDTCSTAGSSPWKSVRVACLLAIRGSQHQALTTKEILNALVDAVPFCAKNSHLVRDRAPGGKRKGWPATVLNVLSTHTIFVQKTPEGRSCKEWRLDVRGENYQVKLCAHNKARLNS